MPGSDPSTHSCLPEAQHPGVQGASVLQSHSTGTLEARRCGQACGPAAGSGPSWEASGCSGCVSPVLGVPDHKNARPCDITKVRVSFTPDLWDGYLLQVKPEINF